MAVRASGWSNFQRNIGPLSAAHRVLLVDQPGFGKSDYVQLTESLPTVIARAVWDFTGYARYRESHAYRHSMGDAASATFAINYPDRIDKMVLMGRPRLPDAAPMTDLSLTVPISPCTTAAWLTPS